VIGESLSVTLVTYNSARFISRCLDYVLDQDYPRVEIIVIDNASSDETPALLRTYQDRISEDRAYDAGLRVVYNPTNVGFAEAQNQAIKLSKSKWVLALNPDVRLTRDFITMMVAAGEAEPDIGSVSGKLLAMSADFEVASTPTIDSTGIYFTSNFRHFDRASQQPDTGAYEQCEYVFGVTGAAALYRRQMIDHIAIFGHFFDPDFFSYREDADVAWRAQLLGWKCVYTPCAIAYHVRSVLPSHRSSVAALLNMHSVKNRFLMRIKNATPRLYVRHLWAVTLRDFVIIAACLLREWSSLRAFPIVLRKFKRKWLERKLIMHRRRATDDYIDAWFSNAPVSYSAPRIAAKALACLAAKR
jgi:GT2 family glycosyltransferase